MTAETVNFSPGVNAPAEQQPNYRHAAEQSAQVEGSRVPLQRRRHAGSQRLWRQKKLQYNRHSYYVNISTHGLKSPRRVKAID